MQALRSPGAWVTLRNIPRTDKARVRLLTEVAPRMLADLKVPGKIIAHSLVSKAVVEVEGGKLLRVMYVAPWIEQWRIEGAIYWDKRNHWAEARAITAPQCSDHRPAREESTGALGSETDDTRLSGSVK